MTKRDEHTTQIQDDVGGAVARRPQEDCPELEEDCDSSSIATKHSSATMVEIAEAITTSASGEIGAARKPEAATEAAAIVQAEAVPEGGDYEVVSVIARYYESQVASLKEQLTKEKERVNVRKAARQMDGDDASDSTGEPRQGRSTLGRAFVLVMLSCFLCFLLWCVVWESRLWEARETRLKTWEGVLSRQYEGEIASIGAMVQPRESDTMTTMTSQREDVTPRRRQVEFPHPQQPEAATVLEQSKAAEEEKKPRKKKNSTKTESIIAALQDSVAHQRGLVKQCESRFDEQDQRDAQQVCGAAAAAGQQSTDLRPLGGVAGDELLLTMVIEHKLREESRQKQHRPSGHSYDPTIAIIASLFSLYLVSSTLRRGRQDGSGFQGSGKRITILDAWTLLKQTSKKHLVTRYQKRRNGFTVSTSPSEATARIKPELSYPIQTKGVAKVTLELGQVNVTRCGTAGGFYVGVAAVNYTGKYQWIKKTRCAYGSSHGTTLEVVPPRNARVVDFCIQQVDSQVSSKAEFRNIHILVEHQG